MPPSSEMNWRRCILPPDGSDRASYWLKQAHWKGQNCHMSALGQKQTYAVQKSMSALHPIATEKADMREWSCLLYPQERTCAVQLAMSAMGQKRTWCTIRSPRPRWTLSLVAPRCRALAPFEG